MSKEWADFIIKKCRKQFSFLGKTYDSDVQNSAIAPAEKRLEHMLSFPVVPYAHWTAQDMSMYLKIIIWLSHCLTGQTTQQRFKKIILKLCTSDFRCSYFI